MNIFVKKNLSLGKVILQEHLCIKFHKLTLLLIQRTSNMNTKTFDAFHHIFKNLKSIISYDIKYLPIRSDAISLIFIWT